MADINRIFFQTRTVVYGIVILFAVLELALAAAVTNWTNTTFQSGYFAFAAFAIATSILTLLTLPVMYFFSAKRKGAIVSMIAIEFGWTAFLWILWLAVASTAASFQWLGTDSCSDFVRSSTRAACNESKAITAFGFLTWIPLMFYNIFLLSLIIRHQMRGTSLWNGYISDTDFNTGSSVHHNQTAPHAFNVEPKPAGSPAAPLAGVAPQYPPTQQNAQPNYTTAQAPAPQQAGSPYPQV
ncbi:hypothetical protein CPC08DRAFT_329054 [Agrocybe pediades]|nr:hypothetical protein CPC08DRAFT_329054 [Agrocybe pediades]